MQSLMQGTRHNFSSGEFVLSSPLSLCRWRSGYRGAHAYSLNHLSVGSVVATDRANDSISEMLTFVCIDIKVVLTRANDPAATDISSGRTGGYMGDWWTDGRMWSTTLPLILSDQFPSCINSHRRAPCSHHSLRGYFIEFI